MFVEQKPQKLLPLRADSESPISSSLMAMSVQGLLAAAVLNQWGQDPS